MKQSHIVFRFLLPPDQNPPEAVHPTMCPLHHPALCSLVRVLLQRLCFFASRADMSRVTEHLHKFPHLLVIVAFVQAKVLPVVRSWLGTADGDALQCRLGQFHIVPVRTINRKANGKPFSLTEQRPLDAAFPAIRRVFAGFFPRPRAPWSWRHPVIATSNPGRASRRNREVPASRTPKTPRPLPTPEIVRARWMPNRCPWHPRLSTGNRCAEQTESRSSPCDSRSVCARRHADGNSRARVRAVQSSPTTRPKRSSVSLSYVCRASSFSHGIIACGVYRQLPPNTFDIRIGS